MASSLRVGAGLLLMLVAITIVSALVHDADARPFVLLLVTMAVTFWVGTLLPRRLAPAYGAVAAAVVAVVVLDAPGGLSGGALAAPLGYGNANGALCAQAAAAAMVTACACRRWTGRVLAVLLAGLLVTLAWQTASAAGLLSAALCLAVGLLLMLLPVRRRATATRAVVIAAAAATAGVVASSALLGAIYQPDAAREGVVDRLVDRALSERRVVLWSESVDLILAHPVTGVGVGRFAAASPTARSDADARWAHSTFLQVGAEAGLVALVLLLSLSGWVFALLCRVADASGIAGVGAASWAALLAHGGLDYVLHFPVVPVLAAATLGVAIGLSDRARQARRDG